MDREPGRKKFSWHILAMIMRVLICFVVILWFVGSDKFFSSPLFFLCGAVYYHTSRFTIGYFSTSKLIVAYQIHVLVHVRRFWFFVWAIVGEQSRRNVRL